MRLRQGRKVPYTLYIQMGPEPSDDDQFIGSVTNGRWAEWLVKHCNLEHYDEQETP